LTLKRTTKREEEKGREDPAVRHSQNHNKDNNFDNSNNNESTEQQSSIDRGLQRFTIPDDNKHNKDRNDISSPSTTTIVATRLRGHDIIFVDSTKFVVDNNHKTTNEPKTPVTRKRFHRCHDNKRRIQQLQPWLTDDVRRNNNNHIFQHD